MNDFQVGQSYRYNLNEYGASETEVPTETVIREVEQLIKVVESINIGLSSLLPLPIHSGNASINIPTEANLRTMLIDLSGELHEIRNMVADLQSIIGGRV